MRRLLALVLLIVAVGPAFAQHGLGAREQWQPQVADTDERLQQSLEIEREIGKKEGEARQLGNITLKNK